MNELTGPDGFRFMEDAPHDGTFVRLRFRPSVWTSIEHEVVAQWRPHVEMKAGGWWFDRQGYYVTPGPLLWAPR